MNDLANLLDLMPFAQQIGIEILAADPQEVRARLEWAPERCTTAGVLHGGALMTLADSAGAVCAFLNLPPDSATSTLESKTNFFRAVRAGHVEATSRPLHAGRRSIVVQTDLRDAEGKLVAQVTQTQIILAS